MTSGLAVTMNKTGHITNASSNSRTRGSMALPRYILNLCHRERVPWGALSTPEDKLSANKKRSKRVHAAAAVGESVTWDHPCSRLEPQMRGRKRESWMWGKIWLPSSAFRHKFNLIRKKRKKRK